MAKPPSRNEDSQLIEAQHQLSAMLHHNAEEGHRAVLEQAMESQITSEADQRALFEQALNAQLRAVKTHRGIIERALDKSRRIEADHRATLQRALSRTRRTSLSQGLLKLSEVKKASDAKQTLEPTDGEASGHDAEDAS